MTSSRPMGVNCLCFSFVMATWRCPNGGKATEQFRPLLFIQMKHHYFALGFAIKLAFVLFLLNPITVNAQDVYKVSTQRLNVRATPSGNGNLVGTINQGVTVTVEKIENGWAQINFNGKTCYTSAKYLSKVEADINRNAESQIEIRHEATQQAESTETTAVSEQPVSPTDTKEKMRLISGSFLMPSGDGSFSDKLNACLGWHVITLNGFGVDFVTRWSSTKYGNRNFDVGPNYSYKLWENEKNRLYATAAVCLSSRVQGMPDLVVTSSGKVKEETKYKYFLDFVTNARISYELRKFTLSAGFVIWAPEFKFNNGYCKTGIHLSLFYPL